MRKVYIVQDQKDLDLSPSKGYGEITVIFPPRVNIYDIEAMKKIAQEALKDFSEKDDSFLVVGNRILNMIAFLEITTVCADKVRLLIYQSLTKSYIEREFLFDAVTNE